MECLGNVRTRELDDDRFLAFRRVVGVLETQVAIGSVSILFLQDTAEDSAGERLWPEKELQVGTKRVGRLDELGFGKLGCQFLGELLRVLLDAKRGDLYERRRSAMFK